MRGDNMEKQNERIQNVVHMLSSIGVKVKKTKSRLDIMRSLTNAKPATEKLK